MAFILSGNVQRSPSGAGEPVRHEPVEAHMLFGGGLAGALDPAVASASASASASAAAVAVLQRGLLRIRHPCTLAL